MPHYHWKYHLSSCSNSIGEGEGKPHQVRLALCSSSNLRTRCIVGWGSMDKWGSMYNMMNKWRMKSMGKWCMIGMGNWNLNYMVTKWSINSMGNWYDEQRVLEEGQLQLEYERQQRVLQQEQLQPVQQQLEQ